jgi:hypothetical protein
MGEKKKKVRGQDQGEFVPPSIPADEVSDRVPAGEAGEDLGFREDAPETRENSEPINKDEFYGDAEYDNSFGDGSDDRELAYTEIFAKRPNRAMWIKVNTALRPQRMSLFFPDPGDKTNFYVIPKKYRHYFEGNYGFKWYDMVPTISSAEEYFLWMVRIAPKDKIETDTWARSEQRGLAYARKGWVQIEAHKKKPIFETFFPRKPIKEVTIPDISMDEMIRLSLESRFVRSEDHPVIEGAKNRIRPSDGPQE